MNHPQSNPFNTEYTEQIITTSQSLDRGFVTQLVNEFFCDAEIEAICPTNQPDNTLWVRVNGWWEDTKEYTRFWVWLTNDQTEYSLNFQAKM